MEFKMLDKHCALCDKLLHYNSKIAIWQGDVVCPNCYDYLQSNKALVLKKESGIDPDELRKMVKDTVGKVYAGIPVTKVEVQTDYFTNKLLNGKDKDLSKPENHDNRHDVSDKVLDTLKSMSYKQDDFGIEKYKKSLHHSYNYDWMAMFFEEIVDGLKYLQNEMDRREVIKGYLETAIKIKDWQHVQKALDLLNISGTGK